MTYENAYKKLARKIEKAYKITLIGAENIPASGGAIVCANHTALFDPAILGVCIKRQIHFMAKVEVFKNIFIKKLAKDLGAFPVNRGFVDVKSLKTAISYLKAGELVGIFPQGTRCPGVDPRTTEPKRGIAMIAHRAEAGILPCYIKTEKRKTQIFRKTVVIIGKFIPYEELDIKEGTASEYNKASAYIFDRVCSLGENDRTF